MTQNHSITFPLKTLILLTGFFFIGCPISKAASAQNLYHEAKKQGLAIYQKRPYTFYCQIPFNAKGELLLHSASDSTQKIQWEHIMPVERFGRDRACWQHAICFDKHHKPIKGRRCCHLKDAIFQKMEADLHNMVPVLAKLNKSRSTYDFVVETPEGHRPIEACLFAVNKKRHQVVVSPSLYGFIARAYLYMHLQYGVSLTQAELLQFQSWNRIYAPTDWERERHRLIAEVQGTTNPLIEENAAWN